MKKLKYAVVVAGVLGGVLAGATALGVKAMPESLSRLILEVKKPQLTDRYGVPFTVTYQNRWNSGDLLPIHGIPHFLRNAFVMSEDKRFFDHGGVDWYARGHALFQNMAALKVVRGASTITEQVVRMIHPRPRTCWSRWLEGVEAYRLEQRFTKAEILEFYLNQVPYAANRRGIVQASRYYFDRDPDTLSIREMLALCVLVRAPSGFDLYKAKQTIEAPLRRLGEALCRSGLLTPGEWQRATREEFRLKKPGLAVDATHFARFLYRDLARSCPEKGKIRTTLDGALQRKVRQLLHQTLADLEESHVKNGAVLVADHQTGEILAWVSAGRGREEQSGRHINAVISPRQPGSSLKPFLYALALEKGWTAATMIDDSPMAEPVGRGLHTYHNYSRLHYGNVTLRQALGNSLNIPAIRAIRFTGVGNYLRLLKRLGITSLNQHPDFYGDGLALGNGEITLYELVRAYTVLARQGTRLSLVPFLGEHGGRGAARIFSGEVSSIIADILSDAGARSLEFGRAGLLNFPVQTAVKTGTSSDYRDSWALGFNDRYTAGVWMGNLDGTPTLGVTGSSGPALVLRSLFTELNKNRETHPLYLSSRLIKRDICTEPSPDGGSCLATRTEWFVPGTEPQGKVRLKKKNPPTFLRPVNNLELAMDPRIPDEKEAFEFFIEGVDDHDLVIWIIDRKKMGPLPGPGFLWHLQKGKHVVEAEIQKTNTPHMIREKVVFYVR